MHMRLIRNMNSPTISSSPLDKFEYSGQFAGFFRDVFGKKRMVLRTANEELYLGIAKPLHSRLSGMLTPGQEVVVAGKKSTSSRNLQLVLQAWIEGEQVLSQCFRVCSKKKCWKAGGKAIWKTLSKKIASPEFDHSVKLETVDCLENCKRGPNVEFDGVVIEHCTIGKAVEILTTKE